MQETTQDFFKDYRFRSSKTVILLVFNKELTLNYLHNINVDTSAWSHDVKDLLSSNFLLSSQHHRAQSSQIYSSARPGPSNNDRSRSRSPRPRDPRVPYNSSTFQSNRGERYDTSLSQSGGHNQGSNLYPPVCIVDVQQLYFKLMSNDQVKSVVSIARHFGITNEDGVCAGNEAR